MSHAEEAERLSRKRARMMPALGVLLVTQQAVFLTTNDTGRLVDGVRATGWLALAAVVLAVLVTGGFWFKSRAVRNLMDDEVTQANRASALTLGFVLTMVTAIALYGVEAFAPGAVTTGEALHIIVTIGLFAALLRFAVLERRALA
jgi:uncharacterized membrane protein